MNRRDFLRAGFAATAGGLMVPEWLLDPFKGRSQVFVGVEVADASKSSVIVEISPKFFEGGFVVSDAMMEDFDVSRIIQQELQRLRDTEITFSGAFGCPTNDA